jgi:hypothetical protein
MSVQAEVVGAGAAVGRAVRRRRALAAVRRAWRWLLEERVDESSARQRELIARQVLLTPSHWR